MTGPGLPGEPWDRINAAIRIVFGQSRDPGLGVLGRRVSRPHTRRACIGDVCGRQRTMLRYVKVCYSDSVFFWQAIQ